MLTYFADFLPRVRAGFEALGMPVPWTDALEWDHDSDLGDVLFNEFQPGVARLRELDPLTTEIVRLRGATQHNCRLCKSRREGRALDAGGSESLYEQIEWYETSDALTDRHKAALRYVDALIWTPADIAPEVAAGSPHPLHRGESYELTVDVMRNAGNKIAVAFAADAPNVAQRDRALPHRRRTGRAVRAAELAHTSMREPMITMRSRGRPKRSAASAVM